VVIYYLTIVIIPDRKENQVYLCGLGGLRGEIGKCR
jgi:hypothetical protein